jgi:geranylgeranyl reductase family protein
MYDVVIVGAGPGGLLAGLHLARHGLVVVVVEEHQAVGTPVHCTGILAREAFDEFDLSRSSILNELTTARFLSPAGREVFYRTGAAEAVVVDRAQFDARLAEQAQHAGARIVRGVRATAMRRDAHGVSVDLAGAPPIHARAGVLACGGKYGLHRQLGLGLPSLFLHTAQAELPAARPQDVELHFGRDIAPKGFAWAVPVWRHDRPYARVGVMCEADAPRYFCRMVERQRLSWGLQVDAGCRPRQKILPLTAIPRTYADHILVVGDAAGLVKPTTGGGIYYSLLTASLAAETLLEAFQAGRFDQAALRAYEERWQERLGTELRMGDRLRHLVAKISDAEVGLLIGALARRDVQTLVQTTARFNWHRDVIVALLRHPDIAALLFRTLFR